ncbi:MAG: hypothetical protein ACYTBJ_26755, partial [Planctomycetota bacterium]
MIKRILLTIAACLLVAQVYGGGIYNNSGSAAADSFCIAFCVLDSAGNMVDMASGDSVFVQIHYPEGAAAYEDSMAFDDSDARITADD